VDFSLQKDIHFSEQHYLQFRAEFFNILNRANFGRPVNTPFITPTLRNVNTGRITETITTAREVQFALKIIF